MSLLPCLNMLFTVSLYCAWPIWSLPAIKRCEEIVSPIASSSLPLSWPLGHWRKQFPSSGGFTCLALSFTSSTPSFENTVSFLRLACQVAREPGPVRRHNQLSNVCNSRSRCNRYHSGLTSKGSCSGVAPLPNAISWETEWMLAAPFLRWQNNNYFPLNKVSLKFQHIIFKLLITDWKLETIYSSWSECYLKIIMIIIIMIIITSFSSTASWLSPPVNGLWRADLEVGFSFELRHSCAHCVAVAQRPNF